ncbi:hypothetical protein IQ254_25910 [Nodosilinea sp. LEGE 07088]|uniref:hypothetical protein n=1 Tax=Nodosilinea sp. LEGE 07088 TaxID=2777968 RepID=UPI00187E8F17|nr:hypothetical protein [Nodosilinea sp. LEGE 07088]MBE9140595.1 hypothetical protein [Nodosilinea sp. LEGE 07088]
MVQTPTQYITQQDFEQLCREQPDRLLERTAQDDFNHNRGSRWAIVPLEPGLPGVLDKSF